MQIELLLVTVVSYIFTFIIGICLGSFANVVIYRLPKGMSVSRGFSVCPHCGARIMPRDLIPIVSYSVLRGRCRQCGISISAKYLLVELLSGVCALLSVWKYGTTLSAFIYLLIFITLITTSFIDIEYMIIPNQLVISLGILAVICAAVSLYQGTGPNLLSRTAGFFVLSLPMLLLTLLISDAFGGGDIKLIAVCGFLLGLKLILLAGFISVLLGGFHGIYLKYIKKYSAPTMAFGQHICTGTIIAALFGNEILQAYFSFIMGEF